MKDRNGNNLAFASEAQENQVIRILALAAEPGAYAEPPLANGTIEIRSGGFHQFFVLADGRVIPPDDPDLTDESDTEPDYRICGVPDPRRPQSSLCCTLYDIQCICAPGCRCRCCPACPKPYRNY